MQEYTSLETSKKIWEMFGWDEPLDWAKPDTLLFAHHCFEWDENDYRTGEMWIANNYMIYMADAQKHKIVPALTLTYLLDKLPKFLEIEHPITLKLTLGVVIGGRWCASYDSENGSIKFEQFAATTVEAAALLCLELGKQGILPRKDT